MASTKVEAVVAVPSSDSMALAKAEGVLVAVPSSYSTVLTRQQDSMQGKSETRS